MNQFYWHIIIFLIPLLNTILTTQTGQITLHFDMSVGNMNGKTQKAVSSLDLDKSEVIVKLKFNTFEFNNPMLEDQFHNTYLETKKFPESNFKGKFNKKLTSTNKQPQKVIVEGNLTMHGVTKMQKIPITITFDNPNLATAKGEFKIKASHYKINIPNFYFQNGKDEIRIELNATYKKNK
jgi:polyisoprenoid-binding protein YceI